MIAIYVRVSTQEQVNGYSIDEQISRVKSYCDAMGWKDYKVYTDPGYSGANTDRPALQQILTDIKNKKINKVAVYKLDRLSRMQKDALFLIEDNFLANGVDFVSVSENFDTSTPMGRAMIGIIACFAQLERDTIRERMSMGKQGRAKEGKWGGGSHLPIGYDYVDGQLVPNEYEKMQILELYQMYLQGLPTVKIEKIFREKGYKHRYGYWTFKRIQSVIDSKIYTGHVKWAGQWYPGTHEAIIDEETYLHAQEIKANRSANYKKTPKKPAYFSGIMFCKWCGARYYVSPIKNHRYYACHSRRKQNLSMVKDPNCKNKIYREEVFDQLIFEQIRGLVLDPDAIAEIKQEKFTMQDSEKEKLLQKEIVKIDNQKSRFMDLYGLGQFSVEELQAKINPLNEQKDKLQRELDDLVKNKSDMTEDQVHHLVTTLDEYLKVGTFEQIRMLILALIEKIEIDGEDIIIYWKFA